MGREIRYAKPGWKHPLKNEIFGGTHYGEREYQPMYDTDYESACIEWYEGLRDWKADEDSRWYHEHAGDPPNDLFHRAEKWTPEEATAVAVYETVSEGTPVTPFFATKDELVDYLVTYGDYWDQKRGHGGWGRERAVEFVNQGFAPSIMVFHGVIKTPRD